jgi:hypothetical protein
MTHRVVAASPTRAHLEITNMKHTLGLLLLAAIVLGPGSARSAHAQANRTAAPASAGQAERNAVELEQGMSLADVQRLLGKPRRTSLKDNGGFTAASSQASLRWTYVWSRPLSSDNVLNVDFIAKAPAEWFVNSWEWTSY